MRVVKHSNNFRNKDFVYFFGEGREDVKDLEALAKDFRGHWPMQGKHETLEIWEGWHDPKRTE